MLTVIEQIKLQEQRQEDENRVKRSYETAIVQLEKEIRNEESQNAHIVEQSKLLQSELDDMAASLALREIELEAWSQTKKQWERGLYAETLALDQEHSVVWQRREQFCDAEREFGEQYGVLAMLSGDFPTEETDVFPSHPLEVSSNDNSLLEQSILQLQSTLESEISQNRAAAEQLTRFTAERKRLENETEHGLEYVRLRNALKYSREETEKLAAELAILDARKCYERKNENMEDVMAVEEINDPYGDSTLQYNVTEILTQDGVHILNPNTPSVSQKQNQPSKSFSQTLSKPLSKQGQHAGDVYKYIMETKQNHQARGRRGRGKFVPKFPK